MHSLAIGRILVAVTGALLPAMVLARDFQVFQPVSDPIFSRQENAQPSPSDLPLETRATPQVGTETTKGRDSACGGKGCCDGKGAQGSGCSCCLFGPDDPLTLFSVDPCRPWQAYGWVNVGFTTNPDNPPNPRAGQGNFPTLFNDYNDELMLNQLYGILERETDTGGCGWDIGGRVDLLYGDDFFYAQTVGLELHDDGDPHWAGNNVRSGIAVPQAYVEIARNDMKLKLGHFYTNIGYERVAAPDNFFYSHAFSMLFGAPFTHTGGLVSWDYSDTLVLQGGLVNGWDKFDALIDRLSFLGGAIYTPCHERYSIATSIISGDEDGSDGFIAGNRTMYSIVFDWHVTERLEYVLQHDMGWQQNGGYFGGQDGEWYGVNQYVFFKVNDCLKLGLRSEWFNDDDGARIMGLPGYYRQATLGANYKPHANITLRPEIRWSWYDQHSGNALGIPEGAGPFITRKYQRVVDDEQMTIAIDAIVTF